MLYRRLILKLYSPPRSPESDSSLFVGIPFLFLELERYLPG